MKWQQVMLKCVDTDQQDEYFSLKMNKKCVLIVLEHLDSLVVSKELLGDNLCLSSRLIRTQFPTEGPGKAFGDNKDHTRPRGFVHSKVVKCCNNSTFTRQFMKQLVYKSIEKV